MPDTAGKRPGLLRMARSLISAPFEERIAREEAARYQVEQYRAATDVLEQTVKLVREDDDGFIPIGSADSLRALTEDEQVTLREQARKASLRNPHAIGYLRTLNRFVLGRGPQFAPDVDPAQVDALAEWWAQFTALNGWDDLEDELAWRLWRDGEVFIRRFVQERDGPLPVKLSRDVRDLLARTETLTRLEAEAPEAPRGMVLLRLIPPEQIADPTGKVTEGIITARDDVQTVLGYVWSVDGDVKEVIPASQVLHIKIRVDSDVKRGRSALEPILPRIKQFDDWVKYRLALNLGRTSIVLHKKIEGATPEQVKALRDAQAVQTTQTANTRRLRMFKPMTTVQTGPGVSYEFKSPKLQAADARHDGRTLLLTMAAATGIPEFMFTGDSSNANFASTLVSESPAIREFASWQDFLTPHWRTIYRWMAVEAARAGQIEGLTEEQARSMRVAVEWPPLEVRDRLNDVKADQVLFDNQMLSREGMARRQGIDWEIERERLDRERDAEFDFAIPPVE